MSQEYIDDFINNIRNEIENTGFMVLPPKFAYDVVDFDFVTSKEKLDKYGIWKECE